MSADAAFTARVRRFTLHKSLEAHFLGVGLRIVDLSETGARAIHKEALVAGLVGLLSVRLPSSASPVALRARVVWSRVLSDGRLETGFVIIDPRQDRAADLLDHLVRLGWAGKSQHHHARNKLRGSEGDLRSARQALDFLARNRSASARWKHLVERELPVTNGYPIEVLAAWELLGRTIDVEVVARAKRETEPFVLDAESLLVEEDAGYELVEA